MPSGRTPPALETPVAELWNLSKKNAGWLEDEGIRTYGELKRAGHILGSGLES